MRMAGRQKLRCQILGDRVERRDNSAEDREDCDGAHDERAHVQLATAFATPEAKGKRRSDAGNLRVEFDVNRCPFGSNIFQAPVGMRLLSGPPRMGTKAGTYKYRVWLNDQMVGQGEVILREK